MLFNSFSFLIFFPIVVLLYFCIPKRLKQLWLLLASYFFYMCWNPKYLLLILLVTVWSFFAGKVCDREKKPIIPVMLTVLVCIGILFVFKYLAFTIGIVDHFLSRYGFNADVSKYSFVLPVGISFYTFQAIGYVIDVYRGDTEAESCFWKYALFIAFFPQLVAGPIERSGRILKQLSNPLPFDYERMVEGLLMMLWGLFVKMTIADRA